MNRILALDRAKNHTGSDSATGRAVGVTPQTVNDWRHHRRAIPEAKRFELADLAALDSEELLSWLREEAGYEKKRATIAASVAGFAGSIAIAFALLVAPSGVKAQLTEPLIVGAEYTLSLLRRWLRRVLTELRPVPEGFALPL